MDLPDSSAADPEPSTAAQLPEPPAEVRIDHADLPATGASDLEAKLITLIDSRLANWGAALPQREAHLNDLVERAIEEWSENAPFDTIIEEWFKDNVDVENIVLAQISELGRSIDKKIERAINDYDYGDVVSEIVRNMSFSIDVE